MGTRELLFDSLYQEHFEAVYGYLNLCFSKELAEDLTQQVFLQAWKSLNDYPDFAPQKGRAWIFRITINVKNDALRHKQRSVPTLPEEQAEWKSYNQSEEDMDEGILVQMAFERLSQEERELLAMKNMGFSSGEIGMLLGITASAVRSRIASAKEHFRNMLQDCGVM